MPLLRALNIYKAYPGVQALDGVTLEVDRGEIHALIGENGAGKSTLIKVITGAVTPDSGSLELDGETLAAHDPQTAKAKGIACIYQQPALFPTLSVTENLALGMEKPGLWRRINWKARRQTAVNLLTEVGARIDPDRLVSDLSMPEQQWVEIARAIGAKAKVLILDEPTACLPEQEIGRLFDVLRRLKSQGLAIIYISHRLEELFELADNVTVLRDGASIATMPIGMTNRADIIRLMVGRELKALYPERHRPAGVQPVELSVAHLGCDVAGIDDISFELRGGEILGLAGLVGSGRTELARTLFGLTPADRGSIHLGDKPVVLSNPSQAIAAGIAYVPEDRRRHGIIGPLTHVQNTSLAILDRISPHGLIDFQRENDVTLKLAEELDLRTPSIFSQTGNLSGGNQQKVALMRWIAAKPEVFIVDEPTQGIDVGAKYEVHKILTDIADSGKAVLLISSDMPEVLGISDRIGVMRQGRLAAVLPREEATQERILTLALGDKEVAA